MAEVAIVARLSGDGEVRRGLQDINKAVSDIGDKARTGIVDSANKATDALKDMATAAVPALKGIGEAATVASLAMGGIFASLGVAGAGIASALLPSVKQVATLGDSLSAMSEKTGIAVENLSTYKFALEQSNSSIETFAAGVGTLSDRMSKASADSGRAGQALKALGIDAVDPTTGSLRNVEEVILDVSEKFSKMEDGAGKSAIAVALFGSRGLELLPFLNQGKKGISDLTEEAKKLGLQMSGENAQKSAEFTNNLKALETQAGSLGREIAVMFLPKLTEIATQMRFAAQAGGAFSAILTGLRELVAAPFGDPWRGTATKSFIDEQKKQLEEYQKTINQLEAKRESSGLNAAEEKRLQRITQAYSALSQTIKDTQKTIEEFESLASDTTPNGRKKGKPPAIVAQERVQAEKDANLQILKDKAEYFQQHERLGESDLEERKRWIEDELNLYRVGTKERSFLEKQLADVRGDIQRRDLAAQRDVFAQEDKLAQWKRQSIQAQAQEQRRISEERARDAEAEIAEIQKTTYATQVDKIAALSALRVKYMEMGDEGEKAYQKITKAIRETKSDAEVTAERMKRVLGSATYDIVNVAQGAQAGFQRTFADILKGTASLTDGMKSLWKNFVDASINEVARLGARTLTSILFGGQGQTAAGGGGGGGAGLLGGLFNGLGGLLGGGSSGGSSGSSGGGIFDGILGGAKGLIGGLNGGLTSFGNSIASVFQDWGVSSGSQGIAEIGNSLNSFFGEGAGSSIGTVAPYLASVYQLTQGNYAGAALTAAGAAIGGPAGAVLGNVLGSALGIGGGSKGYARTTGHDFEGVVTAQGFQGTIYGMAANGGEGYKFALPEGWGAPIREQLGDILRDVLGANTNAQIPISYVADATDPFTDIRNYVRQTAMQGRYIGAFATGGEGIVTQPSLMMVGERGPERFSVTPLAGGGSRGAPAVNVNVNGYSMIDAYSARMMAREMVKILARENRRFV